MKEEKKAQTLKAVEAEVLAEGREWTRQRLQQRLQAQAEETGAVWPRRKMSLSSPLGAYGFGAHSKTGLARPAAKNRNCG